MTCKRCAPVLRELADLREQVELLAARIDGYDKAFAILAGQQRRRHLSAIPGGQR